MILDGCNALVTGASAGLGREFARQLAPYAQSLVLVARREQRLLELRDELLGANPKLEVHLQVIDLSEPGQLQQLIHWIEQQRLAIDLLINNAGLGDAGPFATSDPQRNLEMLLVNMVALTTLTRALLRQMISQQRGAVLNVSSSAGFLAMPEFAVYAATKAYVNSFSEALRAELRHTAVTVTALCPGPVHTEFGDAATRRGGQPKSGPEFTYVPPERVVSEALAAIEADKPLVIPGLVMKFGMLLVRMIPMSILRLAWRFGLRRR